MHYFIHFIAYGCHQITIIILIFIAFSFCEICVGKRIYTKLVYTKMDRKNLYQINSCLLLEKIENCKMDLFPSEFYFIPFSQKAIAATRFETGGTECKIFLADSQIYSVFVSMSTEVFE